MGRVKKKNTFSFRPALFICAGFILLILLGATLLYLPISLNEGIKVSFLDSLFTATSASCVTGLLSINNSSIIENYSLFGRIVICILVQIGGLGVATFAMAFILIVSSNNLTLQQQTLIKESWNLSSFKGLKDIFLANILITIVIELIGALFIFIDLIAFHNELFCGNIGSIIGHSIFLSISNFNNAGFDLFGGTSLIAFKDDAFLLITISFLIILGGLGYLVILDIIKKKFNIKKFSFHTKVVLLMSLILIVGGTLVIYASENIPNATRLTEGMTFLDSYFLSVSARTAGATSYDLFNANSSTLLVIIILMFIGASPGGTGGGIKTTTILVLFLQFKSNIDKKEPHIIKRSIAKDTVKKAISLFSLAIVIFFLFLGLIFFFEGDEAIVNGRTFNELDYCLDAMSAFGTVGLSTGFVPYYQSGSKICLILMMYIGRLGPLTLSTSLWEKKSGTNWKYVDESLPIG